MTQKLLMGNEAIGRALVEAGCSFISAYPGTPSSEVLEAVVANLDDADGPLHVEWSVNEKIAYESALAASYTGKRAAVIMKQVGLNVAADPFARSTYIGVKGGFVVVVADDPGPHSSQNEQDTRLFGLFAKAPVFDPSTPAEAREMVSEALELSERYELPVLLRPTTRICHSRQNITLRPAKDPGRQADFEKNPGRWVATPAFLPGLHAELNRKLAEIAAEENLRPQISGPPHARCAIVASGIAYANLADLLEEMELTGEVALYQVRLPFPLHHDFARELTKKHEKILVLEETDTVIEIQLEGHNIHGRKDGLVPGQGELTPDIIQAILVEFLELHPDRKDQAPAPVKGRRPSLCPGCPHRASFFAIRKTFPRGIFPSDIGCYTLGLNLGAVDTCHCMGACISQGAGFYRAYAQDGEAFPTVVVTIGDSTFFHAGIPALVNAVVQQARIIVTILDNSTTAMTGQQPTPQLGIRADGSPGGRVVIEDLVKACGIGFMEICDPYDIKGLCQLLKEADRHIRKPDGGPAVIITRRGCLMDRTNPAARPEPVPVEIDRDLCTGCGICVERFECPAITFDQEEKKAGLDPVLCVNCGVCIQVCPTGAIRARKEGE